MIKYCVQKPMTIFYNLAECRRARKMTQRQLSRKSGVSTAMISFIENNKRQPTFWVIACIARALEVKIDEIVIIRDRHHYF